MKLRLGITPYLNTKPLMYALINGQVGHNFDLVFDTPSRLSELLRQGKLDMSLIPAIEYAKGGDYSVIPNMAVCATGHVKSVLLYYKDAISDITNVALDDASSTSAVLVKVLLPRCFHTQPAYFKSASPMQEIQGKADAALLIGDQALIYSTKNGHFLDLGNAWYNYTCQPFVFAVFAVRPGVDLGDSLDIFQRAKQWGLGHLDYIAAQEAPGLGLSVAVCQDYITRRIRYDLEADKIRALQTFYQLAYADGLIDREVTLKFYR